MSLFTRPERRAVSYQDVWGSDANFDAAPGDFATFVPVFAAVRLIADAVAQTPLHAYAVDGSGRLDTQPAFLQRPSTHGTRYDWLYRLAYSLLIRGNAYGVVTGIGADGWPDVVEWLNPADCDVVDDDAVMRPMFTVNGRIAEPGAILHIPAFPLPGKVKGLSPIRAFATTTDVGWAAIRFGRDWFANNGNPGAVLRNTKKPVIDEAESKAIKAKFKESVKGRDLLVTGADWDFSSVSIPAEESQFLATIKASANQVAAIYGLPPERIGGEAASSRSYANLDMDLRYVRSTAIAGWLTQIEQALDTVSPPRQYAKFNMDATIRADTLTRMQAHEIAIRTGVETVDEAREVEDKPPLSDAQRADWLATFRTPAQQSQTPVTREIAPITFTTVEAPPAPPPAQIHNP